MYPILIEAFGFEVPAWHFFFVLGSIGAFLVLLKLNESWSAGFNYDDLKWVFLACYFGGYFGARGFSIVVDQQIGLDILRFAQELARLGPMTFYGGFLCAIAAGLLCARMRGLSLGKLLDLGLPAGMVGLAFGRIGCWLNGDDYGIIISKSYWWTIENQGLADGFSRVPIQPLSALVALAISLILLSLHSRLNRNWGAASTGLAGVLAYSVARFFLEFLRGDPRGHVGWFSTSQLISLILICVVFLFLVVKGRSSVLK